MLEDEIEGLWQRRNEEGLGDDSESARLAALAAEVPDRAKSAYLIGRALDATAKYNPEAESQLSRAVKLAPEHVEAWNALGHVFWKKQDLASAKDCYEAALRARTNDDSLIALSMLQRRDLDEAVSLARRAIPKGWYALGNALMCRFLQKHQRTDARDAMKAYQVAGKHPDLYFNRANLKRYLEDYVGACNDLGEVSDASLKASELIDDVKRWAAQVKDVCKKPVKMKKRRELLAKVPYSSLPCAKHPMDLVTPTTTVIHLVIALELRRLGVPPDVFVAFVKEETESRCLALSVYNTDTSSLVPGVVCTVTAFDLVKVDVPSQGESYDVVRVLNHANILVDGTPLSAAVNKNNTK